MSGSSPKRLTLVVGPANSGKQGLVLDWWQERLTRRPVVVVPTGPDAHQVSLEMAGRLGGLVGQDRALTFDGLVRLVLGRSPRYATDLERTLIAGRILRETRLEALSASMHLPGVVTGLVELLEQLWQSGRDRDDLDRVLARWAVSDPRSGALAGDIRRLARAQEKIYAALGLTDRPVAVREARPAAGAWERPVAFYGFTSFTAGQRALVEALSRRAEVLVTFTYDRSRAVNLSTPGEISWWISRASEVKEVAPPERAYTSAAVAYLERYFMCAADRPPAREAAPACSKDDGVRFLLASGRRAEAELAAEKVADLIRGGCRPGQIAVIVRHVRPWSGLLGDVFESCGIPYHMDDRRCVRETGLGHAFLQALRGVSLDEGEALLAYLRSPYSGLSLEETGDLELAYRRGTARGARAVARIAADGGSGRVERLWKMVDWVAVGSDLGREPGVEVARGHVLTPAAVPEGAGPWFVPAAAGSLIHDMLIAGLHDCRLTDRTAAEDVRVFRALQGALRTMISLASLGASMDVGGAEAGRSDRLDPRLVLHSLGRVAVPGERSEDDDAVQILSVQRARARRFQAVVILGLAEGEFPGSPDRPSLLSAGQRARLDEAGGGLLPPEPDQEAAFFVSAISRPWRLLLLSARDAEDDGTESVPSPYWQEARRLLGLDGSFPEYRTLADQVFALHKAPSLRHYLRACAAYGCAPHPAVVALGFGEAVPPWGRPPSRLADPAVLEELASTGCFNPSALEAYADCPFRWFVERVVGAEDIDLELDGRMIGRLLHDVLSETYRTLSAEGLLPLREPGVRRAGQVACDVIDRLVWEDRCPGSFSERRLAAWRLKRMARNLFDMEAAAAGPLTFSQSEMWVGGNRGVDIGGLRVRGRIDRVDATPDGTGVFILDYKTGAIPPPKALGTGEALQLPLYLLALAAERPRAGVIGGAYLSLSDKKRSGVVAAGAEWVLGSGAAGIRSLDEPGVEELSRLTVQTAIDAAEGMRTGVIAPRADRPCPSWCPLGPACRARRGEYRP